MSGAPKKHSGFVSELLEYDALFLLPYVHRAMGSPPIDDNTSSHSPPAVNTVSLPLLTLSHGCAAQGFMA